MNWAQAKAVYMQFMEKQDVRLQLYALVCDRRQEHEHMLDWVQRLALRKNLMGDDVTLTESLWVDLAWCQMTQVEHRILRPKSDTLAVLETKLLDLNSRDLPAYRSSMCSRELERIPTLIKGRNSAPKNKQKDKGPKSGRDDD